MLFSVKMIALGAVAIFVGVAMPFAGQVAGPANAQESADQEGAGQESGAYTMFLTYFDRVNGGIEENFGEPLFTKVENKGDGALEITATQTWIASPRSQRNAVDLHSRWKKMNRNVPVKIKFIDEAGVAIIVIDEGPSGPRVLRPSRK